MYSLIVTCNLHDVDRLAYPGDVLIRVDTHPDSQIDELLPHRWLPPPPTITAVAA
jgi:transposase